MEASVVAQTSRARALEVVRSDGLRVFLDGDPVLDRIRLHEPDRRKVILAVALRRAQQIALNYASHHAPDLLDETWRAVGQIPLRPDPPAAIRPLPPLSQQRPRSLDPLQELVLREEASQ